ncbi:hypothetical protein B0T17DRAFT_293637 [Bombardia bombarda]|uniref:Uncharacterized protein n=1 Tax=Bombardia bombarda TaxID=252184 RepID=A0AA40C1H0_9PEZI|nr:hypothetical protein B0T17DRAFT_293637 [Bombardia bombarda]
MDDAARLVTELHDKLAELDGKVIAYQRDMLAQFHRQMEDSLKNLPEHVSTEVSRVIAESMHKYPALNSTPTPTSTSTSTSSSPDGAGSPSNVPTGDRTARDNRKRTSPPPVLYHTSGVPKESMRSPHDREKEFQGLFTPSYLPLLDGSSSDRTPYSPPISPQPAPAPFTLSLENVKMVEELKEPEAPKKGGRPGPVRRMTDRSSTSSIDSTSSESKVRRSALRRSSSSTKDSPRRVRFEFQGEEVLPSSSPREVSVTPFIMALPSGVDGVADGSDKVEAELVADTSAIVLDNESPAYSGTSLLDVEGEEDFLPRPKKVSSTQALRALSRNPLDAGTVWTVVNPDADGSAKMNGSNEINASPMAGPLAQSVPSDIPAPAPRVSARPSGSAPKRWGFEELLGSPREEVFSNEDEDASDEEFLSMRRKSTKKPALPAAPLPPPTYRNATVSFVDPDKTPTLSATELGDRASHGDEDALFGFEDAQPDTQPSKYIVDDDDDDDDATVPEVPLTNATAAAKDVSPPASYRPTRQLPPTSPSAALFSNSVGSYKGTPLRVNPMNDPQLYDEIASMKDVHFFVGSVDGRSGVEAADLGTYRASVSRNYAGTPRSFTERLAMEEAMDRRRPARGGDASTGG